MDFNDVVESRIDKIRSVLATKGNEYGKQGDRYHNFRVAGRLLDTSPERALIGMEVKHRVSVMDLVDTAEEHPQFLNKELISEKIGDAINYLILLEGMLYEHLEERTPL